MAGHTATHPTVHTRAHDIKVGEGGEGEGCTARRGWGLRLIGEDGGRKRLGAHQHSNNRYACPRAARERLSWHSAV